MRFDVSGRGGNVGYVEIKKGRGNNRALRDPSPDQPSLRQSVSEEGPGLPTVKVIGKPADEGHREGRETELLQQGAVTDHVKSF